MLYALMVIIFIIGYAAIALEHNLHIDKAASALLTGVLTWTVYVFGAESILNIDFGLSVNEILEQGGVALQNLQNYFMANPSYESNTPEIVNHFIVHELQHHLIEISEILFFLLGAMTIVELVDAHEGFSVITDKITTKKKVKLIWLLSIIAFFFSAALDNLTTAIVMSALLKKLIKDKEDIWLFGGTIIIAANAGGAWSPIGDVTTIMLWIGGQVTAANIILKVILPSIICLLVPLIILTFTMKGNIQAPNDDEQEEESGISIKERNLIFGLGVALFTFRSNFLKPLHTCPPLWGYCLVLVSCGWLPSCYTKTKAIKLEESTL